MRNVISKFAPYLKERSTWLGIVGLFTSFGWAMSPEDAEIIVSAGLALGSIIGILFRDPQAPSGETINADEVIVDSDTVVEQRVNANSVAFVDGPKSPTPNLDDVVRRAEGGRF